MNNIIASMLWELTGGSHRSVGIYQLDIVLSEFELLSRYYVQLRISILGEGVK